MLAKVPAHIQVRILHPQSEEAVPHIIPQESHHKKTNPILKAIKKTAHSSGISLLIAVGIFSTLKLLGLELGNLEASIIIFFPAFLGLLTSFVIF